MWSKIVAFASGCFHSATMWMMVVVPEVLSWGLNNYDLVTQVLLDDQLKAQATAWLGADPKALAFYLHIVAVAAFASRARSLVIAASKT